MGAGSLLSKQRYQVIFRELLTYWRNEGKALQGGDGRWRLHFDPYYEAPGSLTMRLIEEPLRACAQRAQDLGYDLTYSDLREWLRLAAWEGDIFTDEALAHTLGLHGDDGQLEDFQSLLDDALCRDEDGVGILEELEDPVKLATHDLAKSFRYMARYRIVPPVLRSILLNNQQPADRIAGGQTYARPSPPPTPPSSTASPPSSSTSTPPSATWPPRRISQARYIPPSPVDPSVWSAIHIAGYY